MGSAITSGITTAIGAIGDVFEAIFTSATQTASAGAMNAILPCIGLAVGYYAVTRGVGFLKSLVQGY